MPREVKKRLVRTGYSVETRTPSGRSSIFRTGDHHADRVARGLGVLQLAERDDLRPGLFDPIAAGYPDVEEPLGDVHRDLLWAKDSHLAHAWIVDGGAVINVRAP